MTAAQQGSDHIAWDFAETPHELPQALPRVSLYFKPQGSSNPPTSYKSFGCVRSLEQNFDFFSRAKGKRYAKAASAGHLQNPFSVQ
jgi:hypothetical protein